jgi:phage FluMu protein Com
MAIKGHKKSKEQHWEEPWPRKQILKHTEGKCPYCKKHSKNLEEHIKSGHKSEKEKQIEGTVRGHD